MKKAVGSRWNSRFMTSAAGLFFKIAAAIVFIGCDDSLTSPASGTSLESLPPDTGGEHVAHPLGSDTSSYGYYLYKPSGYADDGLKYPLLIFLHSSAEQGNSMNNAADLNKILVHGPPKLIKNKTWSPKYPMVVASLQCHDGWWNAAKVKQVTEFLMNTYQIDTTRIYMTGLSMGGYGTWDQLTVLGKSSHITAAVPICGAGVISDARMKNAALLPIWAFHGADDTTVSPDYDKAAWKAINALAPAVPEKLTMYPATGHDSWTKTYDGTGMGKEDKNYDAFNTDIYSWMLLYQKH